MYSASTTSPITLGVEGDLVAEYERHHQPLAG
jgi:hypothetical protein